jgi:hypothetical protein
MSAPVKSSSTTPRARVTRIRIEYDDGSCDTADLTQVSPSALYGFTRKRKDTLDPRGAYTAGAIAALLFKTAITTLWTDYDAPDHEIAGLLRCWIAIHKKDGTTV